MTGCLWHCIIMRFIRALIDTRTAELLWCTFRVLDSMISPIDSCNNNWKRAGGYNICETQKRSTRTLGQGNCLPCVLLSTILFTVMVQRIRHAGSWQASVYSVLANFLHCFKHGSFLQKVAICKRHITRDVRWEQYNESNNSSSFKSTASYT